MRGGRESAGGIAASGVAGGRGTNGAASGVSLRGATLAGVEMTGGVSLAVRAEGVASVGDCRGGTLLNFPSAVSRSLTRVVIACNRLRSDSFSFSRGSNFVVRRCNRLRRKMPTAHATNSAKMSTVTPDTGYFPVKWRHSTRPFCAVPKFLLRYVVLTLLRRLCGSGWPFQLF